MHEQSDSFRLQETIMDHETVQNMDAHERHDLANQINGMTFPELETKLADLNS